MRICVDNYLVGRWDGVSCVFTALALACSGSSVNSQFDDDQRTLPAQLLLAAHSVMKSGCLCSTDVDMDEQLKVAQVTSKADGPEDELKDTIIGSFMVKEFRRALHSSVRSVIIDRSLIEELQDKIRNQEDYIQCLEDQVKGLQFILRGAGDKTKTSGESLASDCGGGDDDHEPTGPGSKAGPGGGKHPWRLWFVKQQAVKDAQEQAAADNLQGQP